MDAYTGSCVRVTLRRVVCLLFLALVGSVVPANGQGV